MECPVCLEENIDERACRLRCGHHICNRCIVKLEQPLCPTCRAPIFPRAAGPPAAPPPARNTLELHPDYFRNPALIDENIHDPVPFPLPIQEIPHILESSYQTRPMAQDAVHYFRRASPQLRYALYSPLHFQRGEHQ